MALIAAIGALTFTLNGWGHDFHCHAKQLLQKDCHIKIGGNKIQVWNDKIFLKTQVERDIKPLPIQANAVEWVSVTASKHLQRDFLEISLWGPPHEISGVESLIWSVYELKESELHKAFEKVVGRRKKVIESGFYKMDKRPSYQLKVSGQKLHWHVDKAQGVVE